MPRRLVCLWLALPATLLFAQAASAADAYSLARPQIAGELSRVKVSMKVGGELFLKTDGKQRSLPMSAVAELEYGEKVMQVGDRDARPATAFRSYERAEATLKLEKGTQTPSLAETRRLVFARAGRGAITLAAAGGALTREELDLIDTPGNSLLLQDLLPEKPVEIGARWQHADDLLARLLGLEVVSQCHAESTLEAVSEGVAKLVMAGNAQGAVGGVTAQLEFKAKYEVRLATGRVTWFALLIKDKRPPGPVNPGLDVVAKIVVDISPLDACPALEAERLAEAPSADDPKALLLSFQPAGSHYELQYDRRWFVTTADRDVAILRLMDRGELVAQCNVSQLPNASQSADGNLALEQFEEHVRAALGKRFGRVLSASQSASGDGRRRYRVAVEGQQADLPIRWIYYLVSGQNGDRVSLTFTLEDKLAEQFGAADEELVARLRIVEGEGGQPREAARK